MLSPQNFEGLMNYINHLDENYENILGEKVSQRERVASAILTMNEEFGEFSDEIKRSLGLSFNKRKQAEFKRENLEEEAADTLISLLLIFKSVGIDNLDDVIHRKIEKNNKRGY